MRIRALQKTYEGRTVLSLPELELEPGLLYAVIGANGSGKSTFARLLADVLRPDDGKAALSGVRVGYMPQKSYAFHMTVEKNILLGGGDRKLCRQLMEELSIEQLRGSNAVRLSGGETAKMALCRVLKRPYELLILDEPTAAMDMPSTIAAEALLQRTVRESGCTLLLVTHSLSQARRLADSILFLQDGCLVEMGQAKQMLAKPKDPRTKAFLDFYGV